MIRAFRYDVIKDFESDDPNYVSHDPYWVIAVVRVGLPLSFSRATMSSVTKDVTQGVLLRNSKPLIITDDCLNITVSANKRSHVKTMQATLKQVDVNYLVEILDNDWVFCWMVNNRRDYEDLLKRLNDSEISKPCNTFKDGLKFVGRVHSIRLRGMSDPASGTITATYSLTSIGFKELDTQFFYDYSVASADVVKQDFGLWLARIGIDLNDIFQANTKGVPEGNINEVAKTFFDVIVGKGPARDSEPSVLAAGGETFGATVGSKEAPYAYLVPELVGRILGRNQTSKPAQMLSYADLIDWVQGVQSYSNRGETEAYQAFVPDLDEGASTPRRLVTNTKMLGTFLPQPPDFINRSVWSVLNQYTNPAINEMYTTLKVNPDGLVVPTIVFRQIPFTTDAFNSEYKNSAQDNNPRHEEKPVAVTRFLDLPRWYLSPTLIYSFDIGRSGATRFNFVHVYGASSILAAGNVPIQAQMVASPPIRDDLDIQRSGVHAYMTTVDCWVGDQASDVPGKWMSLIADWTIGSQFTFNGHVSCVGIQAPIAEGDNVEFDGVVYHVEAITHSCGIDGFGSKTFSTSLQLTNGMRADSETNTLSDTGTNSVNNFPIYPGFDKLDNTALLPGIGEDGQRTAGGDVDTAKDGVQEEPLSPLNPDATEGLA